MKESKFIELLNLYIDQQISPEDAALLEEEILRNPRRRQIYGQYCRMHRACTIVLDRQEARDEAAPAKAPGRAMPIEAARRFGRAYYAAGLAAAACLALVAARVVFSSGHRVASEAVAAVQHAPAIAKAAPVFAATPVRMEAPDRRVLSMAEGYFIQRLRYDPSATGTPDVLSFAVSDMEDSRIKLPLLPASALRTPLRPSIEDFVFTQDAAVPENPKIFRARRPGDETQESTALQFQR